MIAEGLVKTQTALALRSKKMKLSIKQLEIIDIAMIGYLNRINKAENKGFEFLHSVKDVEEAHAAVRAFLIKGKEK